MRDHADKYLGKSTVGREEEQQQPSEGRKPGESKGANVTGVELIREK